jgi:hypothetical protein
MIEMEPPEVVRYRRPVARLSNKNRQEINEYGLVVPSKRSGNYEPNINGFAVLMNAKTGFNFKKKANKNKTAAQNVYMKKRATMKNNVNMKKNTMKNNATMKNNGKKQLSF